MESGEASMKVVSAPVRVAAPPETLARFRWAICGLLFFATTVNYIDRQVIGLLKPVLEKDLGWSEADYSWIVFAFQAAYAAMMPLAGRFIDKVGTRLGYLSAVAIWSIAAMCHALAGSAFQFGIARFALGLGESANFPAALKVVASWFPLRERTLATGLFNSGANIGAIIAPLCVPWLAIHWGWRSAFLITGAAGVLWIAAWWSFYREPEYGELQEQSPATRSEKVPYAALLADRAAWAYFIGKFLTDPVWWFLLFWLPGFLSRNYKLDLSSLGLPLIIVYQASMIGSIGGGWLSAALLKHGWTLNAARKTAMLVCALAVTPMMFIGHAQNNLWLAVTFISLGAAAHQGWSANIFNLPGDLFPRKLVASVVGLGGMGGAIGGMLASPAIGYWLDFSHDSYTPLFVVAGTMYLTSLLIIHLLAPRLTPVTETT
jgi:ACS family hexuronate transporter-like MFS transporter